MDLAIAFYNSCFIDTRELYLYIGDRIRYLPRRSQFILLEQLPRRLAGPFEGASSPDLLTIEYSRFYTMILQPASHPAVDTKYYIKLSDLTQPPVFEAVKGNQNVGDRQSASHSSSSTTLELNSSANGSASNTRSSLSSGLSPLSDESPLESRPTSRLAKGKSPYLVLDRPKHEGQPTGMQQTVRRRHKEYWVGHRGDKIVKRKKGEESRGPLSLSPAALYACLFAASGHGHISVRPRDGGQKSSQMSHTFEGL